MRCQLITLSILVLSRGQADFNFHLFMFVIKISFFPFFFAFFFPLNHRLTLNPLTMSAKMTALVKCDPPSLSPPPAPRKQLLNKAEFWKSLKAIEIIKSGLSAQP